jgi:hypothetical protein
MAPIEGTDVDEFAPVTVPEAPPVANRPPPEKALADLEDALGLGLDDEDAPGTRRSRIWKHEDPRQRSLSA